MYIHIYIYIYIYMRMYERLKKHNCQKAAVMDLILAPQGAHSASCKAPGGPIGPPCRALRTLGLHAPRGLIWRPSDPILGPHDPWEPY